MMSPKIWMMNLILAAVSLFFGINAYQVWNRDTDPGKAAAVAERAESKPEEDPVERFVRRRMPAESAYEIVAVQNLFSPDRREMLPEEPSPDAEPEPAVMTHPISGEAIILYGVVIREESRKALINNPGKQTGGRDQIWVKAGDALANLKVHEIREDRIFLTEGSRKYEILLHDKNKAKSRKVAAPPSQKAPEAPTVITNAPPKVKPQKPEKPPGNQAPSIEKRMLDNPFRRQFPKQNP